LESGETGGGDFMPNERALLGALAGGVCPASGTIGGGALKPPGLALLEALAGGVLPLPAAEPSVFGMEGLGMAPRHNAEVARPGLASVSGKDADGCGDAISECVGVPFEAEHLAGPQSPRYFSFFTRILFLSRPCHLDIAMAC
jgi:hypothetical protein